MMIALLFANSNEIITIKMQLLRLEVDLLDVTLTPTLLTCVYICFYLYLPK